MFLGYFDSTDASFMCGLFWDRLADRWSMALGADGRVVSGNGQLWHDDAARVWRVAEGPPGTQSGGSPVVTGTGASASRGPVLWVDPGTTCTRACLDAGMTECVDAWAGSTVVGCFATAGRRICACR